MSDTSDIVYDFAMEDDLHAALPRYQSEHPEHAEAFAALLVDVELGPPDEPWDDDGQGWWRF